LQFYAFIVFSKCKGSWNGWCWVYILPETIEFSLLTLLWWQLGSCLNKEVANSGKEPILHDCGNRGADHVSSTRDGIVIHDFVPFLRNWILHSKSVRDLSLRYAFDNILYKVTYFFLPYLSRAPFYEIFR
jgi:hypothetical protein